MIRRNPWLPIVLLSVLPALGAAPDTGAEAIERARQDDLLLQALELELARSFEKLPALETPEPLYFLGYEAWDIRRTWIGASRGALTLDDDLRSRSVDVDLRVGNHQLDNTRQLKGPRGRFSFPSRRYRELPIEDDTAAIRANLWEATDDALNAALTRFTKIKTDRKVSAEVADLSADFSVEQPALGYRPVSLDRPPAKQWQELVRRLSAAVRPHEFILQSSVTLLVMGENRYIVNSEGSRIVDGKRLVRLSYSMNARTEDGMDLQRFHAFDAQTLAGLPPLEQMLAALQRSAAELAALTRAPLVEPYTGPAIFRNRAAAVFFHEILGHRLEGHRQKLESEGQTFTGMLGQPIVAKFISVIDDPTTDRYDDRFLRGAYRFDDEGVAARPVTLVENGVLKGFLLGRSPIEGFPRSNGHGRRSSGRFPVARMSNLRVVASERMPYDKLRARLLDELIRQDKPYGYIFDDISGGFTTTGRQGPQSFKVIPHLVYRVYADGRDDEVVRGVDIVGTPLTSFAKIIAAADDDDIFNGDCGAESGWVPVSAVAPSILVSEIEIEKKSKSSEKPPLLSPPGLGASSP